jgi:ferric-dicitrate binding protein FerR (iron transport regulator)
MDCEQASILMCAKIDGEITSEDEAALQGHLSQCAACRAALEAMTAQDVQLNDTFGSRRAAATAVAERTILTLHHEQTRPASRFRILPMLISAAAGFLVALLLFRPWSHAPEKVVGLVPVNQPAPAGHLALATGIIEFRCPGDAQWQPMPTGGGVIPNSRIRTGPNVRCEIAMNDGSQVRLNSNSELLVKDPRTFSLDSGEMFSAVSPASIPFQVLLAEATVTALGTEFDLTCQPGNTSLAVVEGSMKVKGKSTEATVKTGERVSIEQGNPGKVRGDYNLILATSWVNELLMLKGRDNAELNRRVNDLFARIGEAKMAGLYEEEIRSLGSHCVVPLTKYIQSDLSKPAAEHRHRVEAARILSDMAQPWSIGDLITMLRDKDPDVRYYAAKALHRLKGGADFGRTPEQWRDDRGGSDQAYQQWQEWWTENKSRYPIPPTTLPSH